MPDKTAGEGYLKPVAHQSRPDPAGGILWLHQIGHGKIILVSQWGAHKSRTDHLDFHAFGIDLTGQGFCQGDGASLAGAIGSGAGQSTESGNAGRQGDLTSTPGQKPLQQRVQPIGHPGHVQGIDFRNFLGVKGAGGHIRMGSRIQNGNRNGPVIVLNRLNNSGRRRQVQNIQGIGKNMVWIFIRQGRQFIFRPGADGYFPSLIGSMARQMGTNPHAGPGDPDQSWLPVSHTAPSRRADAYAYIVCADSVPIQALRFKRADNQIHPL